MESVTVNVSSGKSGSSGQKQDSGSGNGSGDDGGTADGDGKSTGSAVARSALEQDWRDVAEHMQTDMETFSKQQGDKAGDMMQNLR